MKRFLCRSLFPMFLIFFVIAASGCSKEQAVMQKAAQPVTDIDGKTYKTVQIGDQIWMAENLAVTRYRNGDPVPGVAEEGKWVVLETGAWSEYDNDAEKGKVYGKLYNWYAVADPRGLAPEGWRIPTEEDWRELEAHLGMKPEDVGEIEFRGNEQNVGSKLKETGTEHWKAPNTGSTNETGFTALAGGYRDNDGPFNFFGRYGAFWTATEAENGRVWFRGMTTTEKGVYRFSFNKKCGFSVRCVKDQP